MSPQNPLYYICILNALKTNGNSTCRCSDLLDVTPLTTVQKQYLITMFRGTPASAVLAIETLVGSYELLKANKIILANTELFWVDAAENLLPLLKNKFSSNSTALAFPTALHSSANPHTKDDIRTLQALIEFYARHIL